MFVGLFELMLPGLNTFRLRFWDMKQACAAYRHMIDLLTGFLRWASFESFSTQSNLFQSLLLVVLALVQNAMQVNLALR